MAKVRLFDLHSAVNLKRYTLSGIITFIAIMYSRKDAPAPNRAGSLGYCYSKFYIQRILASLLWWQSRLGCQCWPLFFIN
jgi:hypothetical protein